MTSKKPRSKPRQEHDPSYKHLFSTPRMVRDLLLGFLPGPWLASLDLGTLAPVPSSFVGRYNRQRHNDVIWRLKSKHSGRWVYIYLLLEFQSRPYKFMAVRVLTYLGLFYETLIRQNKRLLRKGAMLPAVIPIVIYNGKPRWGWPCRLSELLEPLPAPYEEHQPECSFVLVDEGSFADKELEARVKNFVALLFRLENARQDKDLGEKVRILNEELGDSGTPELELAFDIWLDRVVKLRFPGIDFGGLRGRERRTMLSESIGEWIAEAETKGLEKGRKVGRQEGRKEGRQEGRKEGRQEGRKEGRQEGRKEGREAVQDLILSLLEERFGSVPEGLVSKIRRLRSQARLQDVARQIVLIRSLDELKLA